MLLSMLLTLAAQSPPPGVVYVDDTATGANNGTSWTDAFTDLQDALAIAAPPTQVWVAQGVYKPTTGFDRNASFRPLSAVFGGFAGGETTLAERAGLFDRTVLSGDLLGDDGPGFANYADNSHLIVEFAGSAAAGGANVLDGFTITGGSGESYYGGGARAAGIDRVEVRNCRFVANRGKYGGGFAVLFASVRAVDCVFLDNEAESTGGGVHVDIASLVVLERCWFLGNHAVLDGGGGAYVSSTTASLDCVFSGNSTSGVKGGGGIYSPSSTLVIGCTLAGNSAVGAGLGGGGLLCGSLSGCAQVDVLDTILWGNVDDSGSGQDAQVRAYQSANPPELVSCCVQGWVGLGCSQAVFDADPLFLDPDGPDGVAGTEDDLLELDAGSPCIDVGRHFRAVPSLLFDVAPSSLDAARKRRYVDLLQPGDGHVLDLGALERPADR